MKHENYKVMHVGVGRNQIRNHTTSSSSVCVRVGPGRIFFYGGVGLYNTGDGVLVQLLLIHLYIAVVGQFLGTGRKSVALCRRRRVAQNERKQKIKRRGRCFCCVACGGFCTGRYKCTRNVQTKKRGAGGGGKTSSNSYRVFFLCVCASGAPFERWTRDISYIESHKSRL